MYQTYRNVCLHIVSSTRAFSAKMWVLSATVSVCLYVSALAQFQVVQVECVQCVGSVHDSWVYYRYCVYTGMYVYGKRMLQWCIFI